MSFKVGDVVVDEDYIHGIHDSKTGIVESVSDGHCFIKWTIGGRVHYSNTNWEWLYLKRERIKELEK
jgi:hypothetical protein